MHLHTPDGTAVSTSSEGLLPLNQTAQLVVPDLAYHDYEGVALDLDERPRLQRDLGSKNIMLLHNHGTLAVGRTCAEAFLRMYFLERACTMQVRTRMLGGVEADHPTAPDVIEKNAALARTGACRSSRKNWSGRRCCASSTASIRVFARDDRNEVERTLRAASSVEFPWAIASCRLPFRSLSSPIHEPRGLNLDIDGWLRRIGLAKQQLTDKGMGGTDPFRGSEK